MDKKQSLPFNSSVHVSFICIIVFNVQCMRTPFMPGNVHKCREVLERMLASAHCKKCREVLERMLASAHCKKEGEGRQVRSPTFLT